MKVCILTNKFPPRLDGVGDYSFHLANEFQRNGQKVLVICKRDAAIQEAVRRGQFDMPVFTSIPDWNWRAIRPLRQLLFQQRPDWLLVQYVPDGYQRWAMPVWLPILLWLATLQGIRVGITFHEVYVRMTYWPLKYWFVSAVQRVICTALTRIADTLITSIDLYAELLQKHTRKPVHLLPIGSNILPIPVGEDELLTMRQRIAPNGERVISTFGLRRQDLLLKVFEEVLQRQPDTRLLICSQLNISDEYRERYERLKNQIVVTGFMTAPNVYRYLKASNAYFIPDYVNKRGEGGTCNKSSSLATGLVVGLPVVGTRGHMNNKLLSRIPEFSLGDYFNPDELATLLINALHNAQENCPNQRFANYELSWEVVATAYMNYMI